jgi:type II secretory pathway pseudopilin PulG
MTSKTLVQQLRDTLRRFHASERGNVAVIFALALAPIVIAVGTAVDYSRANRVKAVLQSVLDAALIAGAKDGSSNWVRIANDTFSSNLAAKNVLAPTPTFARTEDYIYTGTVRTSVPTAMLGIAHIEKVNVRVNAAAKAAEADNSCILTLDHGQPKSHRSLYLNGAPIVNLSNCSIRSNTSIDCNGHDGSVTRSYAAGVASECGHPKSNVQPVPDNYTDLADNITTECGSSRPGVSWTPGTLPLGAGFKKVNKQGYVEYHVCGDLTLSGSGYLTGASPSSDSVIVIENGSIIVNDKASINTMRTAIVLTGDNTFPARIDFPNGAGKKASLALSPPTDPGNPWQSVALYLDPKLTNNVDNRWGPGATFHADGLVYLGNSDVVTDGITGSSNSKCTKFVMNSFVTNGDVKLDFTQKSCAALGLKQWGGIVVQLIK